MRLFKHLSWVSAANATNGILGLVFVPIAIRRLGPGGYGVFAIYTVLTSYIALVELGLGKNLLRTLAAGHTEEARVPQLQLAAGMYVGLAGLLMLCAPALWYFVPRAMFPVGEALQGVVGRIAVLGVLEYVLGVPASLMQTRCIADEEFPRYSRFVMISGFYRYALGFAALALSVRPDVLVAFMVSRRLIDVFAARLIMGGLPQGAWHPRFAWREFVAMIRDSSAMSIAQILQVVTVSAGSVLVNWSFGVTSLGMYRAVFDLASKIWFVSNTAGLVLFPKFVRLLRDRSNIPFLTAVVPSVVTFSCVGFVLLALVGCGVAGSLLPRIGLVDPQYSRLFFLMVGAICLNAHANFGYEFTQAAGRYRNAILFSGLSLALLIVTFVILRSHGMAIAVGGAWLISQLGYTFATDMSIVQILSPSRMSTLVEMFWRVCEMGCLVVGITGAWSGRMLVVASSLTVSCVIGAGAYWTFTRAKANLSKLSSNAGAVVHMESLIVSSATLKK